MSTRKRVTKRKASDGDEITIEMNQIIAKASSVPQTKGRWHLHEGIQHLANVEPKFCELFLKYELPMVYQTSSTSASDSGMPTHNWEDPPFTVLTQIIVYQQLSGASAGSVWKKFLHCFDLDHGRDLTPMMIQQSEVKQVTDEEGKRKILINNKPSGLSASKAKYIQSLTEAFLDDALLKNFNWIEASDELLFEKLIAVKGLGVWSVHMFMMFALHRPNVLPLGDLGIRRGLCNFFGYPKGYLENKQNLKKMEALCATWSPYSSVASFYLWKHSVEDKKVSVTESVDLKSEESKDQPKKRKKIAR